MHRWWAAAAVVVTIAVAAGCGDDGGGTSSAAGAPVLVVGDSIADMSRDEIATALRARGWAPTVEAVGGSDLADWQEPTGRLVRTVQPVVAVVELGTNHRGDPAAVGPLVDGIMRSLEGVPRVLWLNVQEGKRIKGRAFPPNAEEINAELDAAADRWPNLEIVDFDGFFADHREWHTPDRLHPNDRGQRAIARFVADAIDDAVDDTTDGAVVDTSPDVSGPPATT